MSNVNMAAIFSNISLAQKAGKVKSGEFQVEEAVKTGTAQLVLVATDASENTKKLFKDKCTYREVPYLEFGTKDQNGHAIGKEARSSIAIIDKGFADGIMKKINNLERFNSEESH